MYSDMRWRRIMVTIPCGAAHRLDEPALYLRSKTDLRVRGKADVLAFLASTWGWTAAQTWGLFRMPSAWPRARLRRVFATAGQRKGIFGPLLPVDDYRRRSISAGAVAAGASRGQELDLSIATMRHGWSGCPLWRRSRRRPRTRRLSRQAAEVRGLLEAAVARADALDAVRQNWPRCR